MAGGDLNDAYALELSDGRRAFVKTRADAVPGTYAAEAAGLAWLGQVTGVRVPRVLEVLDGADAGAPRALVLEWVREGRLAAAGEEELGRMLAHLHRAGAERPGAVPPDTPPAAGHPHPPLRLGPLVLPNRPAPSWPRFYAESRLRPVLALAVDRGALDGRAARAVERVCERIEELAGPPEPSARLHGDLWSGNVLADDRGRPWLIDPAPHGGQREVDLAMLRLFGAPAPRCLDAYREIHPLAAGHAERVALWQLFPLLVHAALFGGSYGAAVERAAARYG